MQIPFKKNSFLTNTIIYTITDGVSKGLSFILLPIVSYYLIPAQLGIAANFDVLQSIIMLLAGQAVVNALPYFFYECSRENITLLVSNLIWIILACCVIISSFILIFNTTIKEFLHINIGLQILTVVSTIACLICNINTTLYRLEEKVLSFSLSQIVQSVIQVLLTIVLVIWLEMEAIGKIYSIVFTYSIMGSIHLYLLFRRGYIKFKLSIHDVKSLLNFGIPLLPHSLSFWIRSGFDKVLLTTFCGLSMNGLYSMAMSFGAIYTIFNNAFNNAFVPYLQKRLSNLDKSNILVEKREIVKLSYKIYLLFICLYFLVVILCWIVVHYILDSKYESSFQFIPWILLSLTINSFYNLVIQYPYKAKKTFGLGMITFTSSIIQLLLTYIFIRIFNEDGIKYSIVLGASITTIWVWWYSNRVYPMPWFNVYKRHN